MVRFSLNLFDLVCTSKRIHCSYHNPTTTIFYVFETKGGYGTTLQSIQALTHTPFELVIEEVVYIIYVVKINQDHGPFEITFEGTIHESQEERT